MLRSSRKREKKHKKAPGIGAHKRTIKTGKTALKNQQYRKNTTIFLSIRPTHTKRQKKFVKKIFQLKKQTIS